MKFIIIMLAIAFGLAIIFLNPRVLAANNQPQKPPVSEDAKAIEKEVNSENVKSLMHEIFNSLSSLRPYMVSEEKFKAAENMATIDSELGNLKEKVKRAAHEPALQSPAFRVSRQVLQEHVAETQRIFRLGNKEYARWSLNSTMSMCMSCHSQLPSSSTSGLILEQTGTFVKAFDKAEWLFVARNFDKALEIYNNSIRSYPANKLTTEQVEAALERKVAIYTRVNRNFKMAVSELEKDLNNKDIPEYVQTNIKSWIKTLKKYQTEKLPDPSKATDSEIRKFAEKQLKGNEGIDPGENTRAAMNLVVSGVLYEYLNLHPQTTMTPDILYWLAQCDRNLNNNFFYSLADIYLKQCMLNYPTSPVAKQCYKDYELYTVASYSGSSGTHLPIEVSLELKELRNLVYRPPQLLKKK